MVYVLVFLLVCTCEKNWGEGTRRDILCIIDSCTGTKGWMCERNPAYVKLNFHLEHYPVSTKSTCREITFCILTIFSWFGTGKYALSRYPFVLVGLDFKILNNFRFSISKCALKIASLLCWMALFMHIFF